MSTGRDYTPEDEPQHRKDAGHAAPEGAEVDPLIDLSRDPNPGVADHAKPDDE